MKYLYWALAFIALPAYAQCRIAADTLNSNYNFAVHATSPLGLRSKAGLKLELRSRNTSVLMGVTAFYGLFPGRQFSIEGRRYLEWERGKRGQLYLYAKGIGGRSKVDSENSWVDSDLYGGGLGFGQHINLRHFFLDLNGGFKIIKVAHTPDLTFFQFYVAGPGAVVDMHFNFGFQW